MLCILLTVIVTYYKYYIVRRMSDFSGFVSFPETLSGTIVTARGNSHISYSARNNHTDRCQLCGDDGVAVGGGQI